MRSPPRKLTLAQWDARHAALAARGLREPWYGGPLGRHLLAEGDLRLRHLLFDDSAAALRLWNFLLTENTRLREARAQGAKLVGAMKDLGTIPVMAYSLPSVRAFYPDGAWWTPCLMEGSDGLLKRAEALGFDESFCPVRAMLGAFDSEDQFPLPDLLICSVGAICDDFSAIAQRLEHRGFPILWWEMPRRRQPEPGEAACTLPGSLTAPQAQLDLVAGELRRITTRLSELAGKHLDEGHLRKGIRQANKVRRLLGALRRTVYAAPAAPVPALEMLIAEMLAIHFCSDIAESASVLEELLEEAQSRAEAGAFVTTPGSVRVFWVNPVADIRVMNRLEDWGGRLCGSDFMFTHALDPIPEDIPPIEALARAALADPMVGPAQERAQRIVRDCRTLGAEAVVISRIPGASHCAHEGTVIRQAVSRELGIPTVELEIPSISDSLISTVATRLQALIETAKARR